MIVTALLAAVALQGTPGDSSQPTAALVPAAGDVPRVSLAEALRRSARFDPEYVRAIGDIENAEWGRRAARLAFVLPSITASLDGTKYSTEFFNLGTGQPQAQAVNGRLTATYELFSLRKFTDLSRSAAELKSAEAGEVEQRFRTALATESDYYAVLQNQELTRVARERVARAQEALGVARARVISGAAVQSDSLQLVLELTQARVDSLRQSAQLRVSRLQLGRRVGSEGPVDAEPLDTTVPPSLPIGLDEAVRAAVSQGPQYEAARASERAAEAAVRGQRGEYLPVVTLGGNHTRFDDHFFPGARNVSSVTLTVSFPLWDNASREIQLTQARVNRDVSRTLREDLERSARRDVTEAYEAYETARATTELSETGVVVARENFRVQEARYRAGASTILDFLDAQLRLSQAEADLVQARYANRLALAGLEALLGRRLFSEKGPS